MTSPRALVQGFLTLLTAVTAGQTSFAQCPQGQFFSEARDECQTCATCPTNFIIRKPCSEKDDTMCGPFTEFNGYHQAHRTPLEDLPVEEIGDEGWGVGMGVGLGADSNRSKKKQEEYFDNLDELFVDSKEPQEEADAELPAHGKSGSPDEKKRGKHVSHTGPRSHPPSSRPGPPSRPRYQDNQGPSLQNPDGGESQWKVLALALIVVLCVVCIFLIGFIFSVCYLRSRKAHLRKVVYSADLSPSGRALPTSHRYVPVLTQSPAPGSSLRAPAASLDPNFLYSEDYDADHSGQTVSTTKSSDYVYFKSPHNGNFCDAV